MPRSDALAALEEAFRAPAAQPARLSIPLRPNQQEEADSGGDLLVMAALGLGTAGVKIVTVVPANPAAGRPAISGSYLLLDQSTGALVALLDGAALTALRTPAASALATRALARPDSRRLAVFGTGPQAHGHVLALADVLPRLDTVEVVGRSRDRTDALVARLRREGFAARSSDPDLAAAADVVCTCTSSPTPVLADSAVRPGTHLNAVGAYSAHSRELGERLVGRARVVVDDLAAARAEAGDLVLAASAGTFDWSAVAGDLSGLSRGQVRRESEEEITVFKSVGLPLQDLAVATLAARRAQLLPAAVPTSGTA